MFKTIIIAPLVLAIAQDKPIVCPVLHEPVVKDGQSVQYKGLLVQFCCGGCDVKFVAAPEKYLSEAAQRGDVVATFLFDPVAHRRIDPKDAKATFDYEGIRYHFADAASRDEFASAPALYSFIPEKEVMTCPVMKSKLKGHADAIGFADHKGVRYYFCCAGCDTEFAADPDKFAKGVASLVQTVTGTKVKGMTIMPTCAGCAGEARMLADGQLPSLWTFGYRYVNMDDVKVRHRFTLDYRVSPRLSVGVERSGGDSSLAEVSTFEDGLFDFLRDSDGDAPMLPRASWFVTPQGESTPSVVLGFTSDRLSTPRGQAFFATFSKSFSGVPVMPFVSVKTNSFGGKTAFPFGANWVIDGRHVVQAINDGDYTHLLFTRLEGKANVSLLLARTKYFGMTVSYGF